MATAVYYAKGKVFILLFNDSLDILKKEKMIIFFNRLRPNGVVVEYFTKNVAPQGIHSPYSIHFIENDLSLRLHIGGVIFYFYIKHTTQKDIDEQ